MFTGAGLVPSRLRAVPAFNPVAPISYLLPRDGDLAATPPPLLHKDWLVTRYSTAFIGTEVRTAELVTLAVHLRWPDVDPMVATTVAEGLEMVEREAPDVVVMHPDFTDMTLNNSIRELRRFTNVPLLVLGHQGD